MTKYREILRLQSLGINQTGIAKSCGCSRKTERNVFNRAKELQIKWPLKAEVTDVELEKQLFPEKSAHEPSRKHPDYECIAREMMRNVERDALSKFNNSYNFVFFLFFENYLLNTGVASSFF